MATSSIDTLRRLYELFNARAIETVLASLHPDVVWANGMEGGFVHGRDGVREYWTRQWAMIDPRVEPVQFRELPDGKTEVEVHQTERDLDGKLLLDTTVCRVFRMENGLVTRFEIR